MGIVISALLGVAVYGIWIYKKLRKQLSITSKKKPLKRSHAGKVFGDSLFNLVRGIRHAKVNPFEDNIPNGTYIKGYKIIGFKIACYLNEDAVRPIGNHV